MMGTKKRCKEPFFDFSCKQKKERAKKKKKQNLVFIIIIFIHFNYPFQYIEFYESWTC